jgi:hypothetical protein
MSSVWAGGGCSHNRKRGRGGDGKKGKQWRGAEENTMKGSGKVKERERKKIQYGETLEYDVRVSV